MDVFKTEKFVISEASILNLFQIYDKAGLGEISKKNLLAYFQLIDKRITEKWLAKSLLEQGIKLNQFITCKEFIQIINCLKNIGEIEKKIETIVLIAEM